MKGCGFARAELLAFVRKLHQLLGQELRISTDVKGPVSQLAPVIDSRYPAACRLVFRAISIVFLTLDLEQQGHTTGETSQEVREISVLDAARVLRSADR